VGFLVGSRSKALQEPTSIPTGCLALFAQFCSKDVGKIVDRGPILIAGYYKRPDLTAQAFIDGWLHSGVLWYVDEEGFLYLVDRKKDLILSDGIDVYPRDVEEGAAQHPAVSLVAFD
jgi:long-chain acyl-CoA synthetase